MIQVLTIGHSTLDYFLELDEASLLCSMDHGKNLLCLEYADKIPLKSWKEEIGGNAANSAVGLTRLGVKTGVVTSIGDDTEGTRVLKTLEREGVTTEWVSIEKEGTTDESAIINFKGERTILAYHVPREYHFPKRLPQVGWIYLTSLNEKFADLHRELLEWRRKNPCKLAYNPGMHELKAGVEKSKEILLGCEVLILNREEAEELLSTDLKKQSHENEKMEQIKTLLVKLKEYGPQIAVITDGADGAYSYDGQYFLHQEVFPAVRVEMTGAGDSFSAGLLAALVLGQKTSEALRWGCAVSASVIQKIGSQAGLLRTEELKKVLLKNSRLLPKAF